MNNFNQFNNFNNFNDFNNQPFNPNNQPHQQPLNQFTQSRPLNTQIDSPEKDYIQKTQKWSVIWHLVSILLVFIASAVIHKYSVLIVYGAVGMWIAMAVAVYLMPNEERQNIRKTKVWVIGYTSLAIIFDFIVTNLELNSVGYGLDAAALQFLNIMRIAIFLGTPIMHIGIIAKRVHFNWDVRNNEQKTAAYMKKNTRKLF